MAPLFCRLIDPLVKLQDVQTAEVLFGFGFEWNEGYLLP